MVFINERVSDRDADIYGLDNLKRRFDGWAWREGRPDAFWYAWTIDRDRDIYLIPIKIIEEVGPSGRPEPTSKSIFILGLQEGMVEVILERVHCSSSFSENPFRVGWALREIKMSSELNMPNNEVIDILKEALCVYGYRGVYSQRASNVMVEFEF